MKQLQSSYQIKRVTAKQAVIITVCGCSGDIVQQSKKSILPGNSKMGGHPTQKPVTFKPCFRSAPNLPQWE